MITLDVVATLVVLAFALAIVNDGLGEVLKYLKESKKHDHEGH